MKSRSTGRTEAPSPIDDGSARSRAFARTTAPDIMTGGNSPPRTREFLALFQFEFDGRMQGFGLKAGFREPTSSTPVSLLGTTGRGSSCDPRSMCSPFSRQACSYSGVGGSTTTPDKRIVSSSPPGWPRIESTLKSGCEALLQAPRSLEPAGLGTWIRSGSIHFPATRGSRLLINLGLKSRPTQRADARIPKRSASPSRLRRPGGSTRLRALFELESPS